MKILTVLSVVFTLLLCGCSSDNEPRPSAKNLVQGKWETVYDLEQYYNEANQIIYERPYRLLDGFKYEFINDSLKITYPKSIGWGEAPYSYTFRFYQLNGKERLYVEDSKSTPEGIGHDDYIVMYVSENEIRLATDTQELGFNSVEYYDGSIKSARKCIRTLKLTRN